MRKLSHWLEELSLSESIDFYRDMALTHAREGGPWGADIHRFITRDDVRALCDFEVPYEEILTYCRENYRAHEDVHELHGEEAFEEDSEKIAVATAKKFVRNCRQAIAYFQKVEDLDIGVDKEDVAFQKFLEAEQLCKETNELLKVVRRGEACLSPRVSGVLYSAKRKIANILGRVPAIHELDLRFGPGATRATRRKDASVRRKLAEGIQCSEDLLGIAKYVLEEMPPLVDIHSALDRVDEDGNEWSLVELEIIPAKLSFVPKNAKTYRSICTEPGLNVIVQAGYGAWMARRLAAFGIDIRDQTVNQNRARTGSLTGALATLDLSSASDTVSREIVYELLPLDWAAALNRARSSNVLLPTGEELRQEKFSSMGNGFTFPLETLIFWGLAAACCSHERDATVYGDDIVVPTESVALLTEVLTVCGFKVNLTKSYSSGPFRESCGKDYFLGTDVRPNYPRGYVSGQSLFVLHNWYVRQGDLERAKKVENAIHPALRLYGPDGYGDGHLLGDHPKRRPLKYHTRGYSGYFFDTFVTRTSKDSIPLSRGEYVVPLYTIYRRSSEKWDFMSVLNKDLHGFSKSMIPFVSKYRRGHSQCGPSPLSLPTGKDDAKELPLPEVVGYKKITVYTLED